MQRVIAVEGWKIVQLYKRVVMVCYKRKCRFRCIYKWACPHITFAHKGIAERKKSERE